VSQGGGPGSCNIHLKGCVMDADTRRVFQLGTWLLRHKRQKAKGWLKSDREAKVCALGCVCVPVSAPHMNARLCV
jgi:hypothetical protein